MSANALVRLEQAHEGLIGALDGSDVEGIECKLEELRTAISEVRSMGGWRASPDLKARAMRIAALGEAARIRVNFLTDLTRQRLEMLSGVRGEALGTAYSQTGR
jgi:hypothetical protein